MMESGKIEDGGMAERLNAPVLKTVRVERLSGVRIPLPPPSSVVPMSHVTRSFGLRWAHTGDTIVTNVLASLHQVGGSSTFNHSRFGGPLPEIETLCRANRRVIE
jgi:hypothetical protein